MAPMDTQGGMKFLSSSMVVVITIC